MDLFEALTVAFTGLLANKMRSLLTMLGVIIGVAAVIATTAIGEGLKQDTLDRIRSLGSNMLFIRPGAGRRHGVRGVGIETLKAADAEAILKEVPGIRHAAPEVTRQAQVKFEDKNENLRIVGTTPPYKLVRNFDMSAGRFLTEADERGRARVAVLGSEAKRKLFGGREPLGERIKIKGATFQVIGVLKEKGGGWFSPDEQIVVPLSTAQYRLFGQDYLSALTLEVRQGAPVDEAQEQVTELLRRRHRLRPDEDDDFNVRAQAEFLATMEETGRTMTRLLTGIAAVSLLVGGVGIMNIMLVSVTERTREIGIRKAVGARKRDIMFQFLIEATVLSLLGGLIGVALGVGFAGFVGGQSGWRTVVRVESVLIAFAVAAAVGIFFGWYPARKAAQMDPIEALHYE